jgi:hypothetical protein
LRDDPVDMEHIRIEVPDKPAHGPNLGDQEWNDLKPTTPACSQVLEYRAVSQVLPAPWEIAEAYD